jgi:hypothetical protein
MLSEAARSAAQSKHPYLLYSASSCATITPVKATAQSVSAFPEVFAALKQLLLPYTKTLKVAQDTPIVYTLGGTVTYNDKPREMMLLSVASMKNYVSLHLVPIYMCPEALEGISPELKRHVQGKGCLNFSEVDPKLLKEAAALIKRGIAACKAKKLI